MITSKLPTAEGVPRARALVDRALVANENCPDANSASAFLAGAFEGDWKTAQASADMALEVAPGDARVLGRVASVIAHSGDLQRSVDLAREAVRVDPLNTAGLVSLGVALSRAERWQEASAAFREAFKLSDKSAGVHSGLAIVALMEGNPELALADVAGEVDLSRRDTMTILAHHALGKQELAEQELQQFIEQYRESGIYDIAMIYAHTGKVDEAFEWLEKAVAAGDTGINCMRFEPLLKNLREDSRWAAMLEKVGLSG